MDVVKTLSIQKAADVWTLEEARLGLSGVFPDIF